MTAKLEAIRGNDAEVLVVSFDDVEAVRYYKEMLQLPFAIAANSSRDAYRAYGLTKGSFFQIRHPRTLWRYVQLVRGGMRLERSKSGADLSQLGGDFVLDADGVLRFVHSSLRPDDRPDVSLILDALRALDGAH